MRITHSGVFLKNAVRTHLDRVKRNCVAKNEYKNCVELCNELTRNYEKECEQQVLDANNVGAFYRFANKRLK